MAVRCRWILIGTLLLAAALRLEAESAADRALKAATDAFHDTSYKWAETQLADFAKKYPASPRLPEAILLQAQARIELTNFAGALELLKANLGKAGTNVDQYLFWLGTAYSRNGDWRTASDTFARLLKDYPASSRCLEASIGAAAARSALARTDPAEWPRVIGLLQQTNGVFQEAVRANLGSELIPQGRLVLSEAQLATKDYRGAEATLQPLAQRLMNPKLAWQWQYLLCRIQLADGRTNAALQGTTNLLATAANAGQTNLLAESAAFQATLLESLGRTNDAIAAYQRNLADGVPADRQRQALLKITDLSLGQNNIPQAAQMLEKFIVQYTNAASADLALLTLGELRLRQHETEPGAGPVTAAATNTPATTNGLHLAVEAFSALVTRFPQSPLLGKAQLDLGWCYLREGRLPEAENAFKAAVAALRDPKDLANAYYRLADAQFQQTNYAGAIQSYWTIKEKFANTPDVRAKLLEPALYQIVDAGIKGGRISDATNALQELRALFPRSTNTASAVLLTAQHTSRRGDPATARNLLVDFEKATPDAPLRAERGLAVAATWEQEQNWPEAIAQYNSWLGSFTNHEARARAEYFRARDTSLEPGGATNALALYTAFIAHYPTSRFAPLAQMSVASYYFDLGDYERAERHFKGLAQSTNWPPSDLTYEAQLMAGRAAVRRQGWNDAKTYLTALYNNTNGPTAEVRFQALFEYSRALMQKPESVEAERLENCKQAYQLFGLVCEQYATNHLSVLAWLDRGKCYFQWALARQQFDSLTNALNAYQQVVDSPLADVAERSEAKVGQAVTLENWASRKGGKEQTDLLEQALSRCLDVVYGKVLLHDHEQPVPFWVKEAGVVAFRVADALQDWSQVVSLYQRLKNDVWPNIPASMAKQAEEAQKKLNREKAGH